MRRADHLQCRRGRWSVRLRVPAHLVATVGQTHLVRSLDTSSEAVARERRWVALALLWEWIGAQTVSDGWKPAWAAELTVQDGPSMKLHERARTDLLQRFTAATSKSWPESPPITNVSATDKGTADDGALAGRNRRDSDEPIKDATRQAVREFSETQTPSCTVDKIDRRAAGEFVNDQYQSM